MGQIRSYNGIGSDIDINHSHSDIRLDGANPPTDPGSSPLDDEPAVKYHETRH